MACRQKGGGMVSSRTLIKTRLYFMVLNVDFHFRQSLSAGGPGAPSPRFSRRSPIPSVSINWIVFLRKNCRQTRFIEFIYSLGGANRSSIYLSLNSITQTGCRRDGPLHI
ncbi:hypothetical protein QFZ73_002939 [Peribacillus sp. V2I11]|nr:hypothetical protein [Peribacillus sp. V2I11]